MRGAIFCLHRRLYQGIDMTRVQSHLDRCRQDRNAMFATLGIGFYGSLTVLVLAYDLLSTWH